MLAFVSRVPAWQKVESIWFDMLTIMTAPGTNGLPVVIVGIDEPSFADLQQQWPWPRRYHARLVDALTRGGASVIAFDVLFADPSSREDDDDFAGSIKQAGNVVLAGDMVLQLRKQFEMLMRVEPLHLFREAGSETGISSITPDKDMVVRTIPGFMDSFWRVIIEKYRKQTGDMAPGAGLPPEKARVKYLGPDHAFTYVSYYQALDPESNLPPDIFKNKIVLVGFDVKATTQPGTNRADAFASSFTRKTGWLTPGVEIQANFIANALTGRYITALTQPYVLLATALALVLSLIGMAQWMPVKSSITVLLATGAPGVISWYLFRRHDIWFQSGIVVMAPVLLYIIQGGAGFMAERRQRIAIRKAFQHYVPPDVVAEMIRHPELLKLGGTRRRITIVFTDLKGFTTISESLAPEVVAKIMNDHFTEMTRIIHRHGGTVVQFIGDAIMAFWGAPLDDPEQAFNAVSAAVEMQGTMGLMRRQMISQGFPEIRMRIGIHSGEAIVGNMGSIDRFGYTALGDTVNLASRLEGVNKQYGSEILLSHATAQLLENKIMLMYVDRVVVKGREKPIDIYTPLQDSRIQKTAAMAINTYFEKMWEQSEHLWQELQSHPEVGGIAEIYLDRIRSIKQSIPLSQ